MTCKYPTCSNDVGQQDRDDYQRRFYCSIQCQTKLEHIKMDAKDAQRAEHAEDATEDYY